MSKTNLDVFYYLVERDCNKASVYSNNMYWPPVCYLAMKFGISNKKAHTYLKEWADEKKANVDESNT